MARCCFARGFSIAIDSSVQLEVVADGRSLQAVTWLAPPENPYDTGELELR